MSATAQPAARTRSHEQLPTWGPVPENSALWEFLRDRVLAGALGMQCPRPRFTVQRQGGSAVLHCREEDSGLLVALKSYDLKWIDGRQGADDRPWLRAALMRRELANIRRVRALGLDRPPVRAVRVFAADAAIGCVIAEEFVSDADLHAAISDAALHGAHAELDARLALVATFLARLHAAAGWDGPADDGVELAYLEKVVGQLIGQGVISPDEAEGLRELGRRWADSGVLRGVPGALIHGDATPSQFLFAADGLVVIDFERLRVGDRAADIGRIAGEIKHVFAQCALDPQGAEPHIGFFYRYYHARAAGAGDFAGLTERAQFHMACCELRIARNAWEPHGHRRWLVEEAFACLHR